MRASCPTVRLFMLAFTAPRCRPPLPARPVRSPSVYVGLLGGPFAFVGREVLKILRAAADLVNARGGVLGGRNIGIVSFDGKGTPLGSLVALARAIDQRLPFATATTSSVAHALTGTTAKHYEREPDRRVLLPDFLGTDPVLTEDGCRLWHLRFSAHAGTEHDVHRGPHGAPARLPLRPSPQPRHPLRPDGPPHRVETAGDRAPRRCDSRGMTWCRREGSRTSRPAENSGHRCRQRPLRQLGTDLSLLLSAGKGMSPGVTYLSRIAHPRGAPVVIAGWGAERVKTATRGLGPNRADTLTRQRNAELRARHHAATNCDHMPASRVRALLAVAMARAGIATHRR